MNIDESGPKMQDLRRFQQVDVALLASATKLCTSKQCLGRQLFRTRVRNRI